MLAARHFVLAAAVVLLLAGASYARGAAAQSSPRYISDIQVDPRRPNVVYAGAGHHGVLKSTNGGQTWGAANRGLKAPPASPNWTLPGVPVDSIRVDALALDARSPNVLYAGTGQGVYKTSDGAKTWKLASDGIDLRDGNRHLLIEGAIYALGIDPLHTSTVYAAGMGGVWKTTTGGATWKRVLRYRVLSVAIDPRRPSTVYGSGMKRWPRSTPRSSIYKTVDGGGTWRASGPPGNYGDSIVVDRHRAGTIYAGGSRGLFASANQGRTWRKLLSGTVNAIALDPVRANVLYVGGWASGVVKSDDGGRTWSKLGLGIGSVSTIAIAPTRPQTIFAGGEGIWKSTDGGATWRRLIR
ncbi:MAG: WD40/YVTN/BNR-like repeat-containing protein [Gaiellaceae bacterium]